MSVKLKVTVTDVFGQDRSYTLPNPRSDLNAATVQNVFQPLLDNEYLTSTTEGVYYTLFKKAEIIQTTQTMLK